MWGMRTAAFAAALVCGTGAALAGPSTLQLVIGGEAYDGPPRFEVSFDGKPLGERAVDAAIDTASTGRFAEAADKAAYVESFSFDIPEDVFKPGGEVRVRLTNEAYGGDGSNRDRNLYLASVAVNGRAVTVSGLSTQGTSADTKNELLGEFLVLRDGNMEGVSRPPSGGWPLPDTAVADVKPAPSPAAVEPKPAVVAEVAAPTETVVPAKPPAVVAAIKLPEAPAQPPAVDPVETASIDDQPLAAGLCGRDELYNVIGFHENSNDLTPRLAARLDQIIADIGEEKCKVLVTGYSSRQGDHATNALFAIERAQNVLAYLKDNGLKFEKATATGGGATEQFGEEFAANRRVVITVGP